MPLQYDLLGKTFGRLTVTARAPNVGVHAYWQVRCVCGKEHTARGAHLRSGDITSCGCAHSDALRARRISHGHAPKGNPSPTYISWSGMHQRCSNPDRNGYEYYGGKGIRVCARWKSFENFLKDMGERPPGMSIDRVRSNENYEPGNCVWATRSEQEANKRC